MCCIKVHWILIFYTFLLNGAISQSLKNYNTPNLLFVDCNNIPQLEDDKTEACMTVDFRDGGPKDYAILTFEGPKHDQSFVGYLLFGLDSVSVTADWDGSLRQNQKGQVPEEYIVTILTSRLPYMNMFRLHFNKTTSPISFDNRSIYDKPSDVLSNKTSSFINSGNTNNNEALKPLPHVGMTMNVIVFYDDSFKNLFKSKSKSEKIIRGIFIQTNMFFKHTSLATRIKLNVKGVYNSPNTSWRANQEALNQISKTNWYFDEDANAYVFICSPKQDEDNEIGKSELDATCNGKRNKRISIVEYDKSLVATSHRVAHEIGHNLGMHHDFNIAWDKTTRLNRYSNAGRLCTNEGGIMDWSSPKSSQKFHWSACSVEDFQQYYHLVLYQLGEFCLDAFTLRHKTVNGIEQNDTVIQCDASCFDKSVFGVIWYYLKDQQKYEILRYLPKFKKLTYSEEQKRFRHKRATVDDSKDNLNLIVKDTTMSDEGAYQCEIISSNKNPDCQKVQETNLNILKSGKKIMFFLSNLLMMPQSI